MMSFSGFKDVEQAVSEEINDINDNNEEVNACHSNGKLLGKRQRKRKKTMEGIMNQSKKKKAMKKVVKIIYLKCIFSSMLGSCCNFLVSLNVPDIPVHTLSKLHSNNNN